MSVVFSKDGSRSLRLSWIALALAFATSAALAWGSLWYLKKARLESVMAKRQVAEAQARVSNAKRESDDLRTSSEVFQDLVRRGVLEDVSRLDFIERLDRLKNRHRLIGLQYEIAPQQPLQVAGGRTYAAIDVLGSRVKVNVKSLHEGDALAFLDDLARPPRGFSPVSLCALRRVESASITADSAHVEADCTLEWISLKDKRGGHAN
jgi:hypothetical protein